MPKLVAGIVALSCAMSLAPKAVAQDARGFVSGRISVKTEGTGPDVVLIHGLGSSPRVWTELVKAVPGHRYHLIHIAGFAGQPVGANREGNVVAAVAEEIARYITTLGSKPAVIGHSMGGSIGLMIAVRHPQAISKLMVVDMPPSLGVMFGAANATPEQLKQMADQAVAQMKPTDPAAQRQRAEMMAASMINTPSMRAGAVDDMMRSDADVSARAMHELIVTDLGPEISKIAVPTTVLYVKPVGVPVTEEQIDSFYAMAYKPVPGVMLKRIPDAAHMIMWDQQERFQNEVRAFLK